ncbi:tudor domain-containing protein 1 isoform X1 [Oryzias melastigma]|uniref:tudor domain-containing protein 1 isoform X1 n=1 Tax=Oryzias melastigma TaxID=30732 RepID=UPI000CF83D27|nr:tudor domain-containing protein 1 isoform X1 [Oryzias melastigma]
MASPSFTEAARAVTTADMNPLFMPNLVRPNRPLREPASRPGTPSPLRFPPPHIPDAAHVDSAAKSIGVGLPKPANINDTTSHGLVPPALTVHFCHFCGQKGNFRCKRCKKTSYCSADCQTKDWKAHRHVCKSFEPETAGESLKENPVLQSTANSANIKEPQDSLNIKRVYLKDLNTTKYMKGAEMQGVVVEFHSPGRFFIHPEDPMMAEALMSITVELQKTPNVSTGTPYVPCVGEVCSVQFSCDLSWYRGLIQTLAADQKAAHVLYIDYGNEENVPVERIKPLSVDAKPFCPCAMECQIAGVVPVADSWSSECCMAARQLLSGKVLTIKLVDTLKNGYVHSVDIQLSAGKQLSTFLLEQEYALAEADGSAPAEKDKGALLKASVENFQRCSDGKDNNDWAQLPEPLTQAVGDRFSVVVSHFQSPNDFIVQKVENGGVIQDLQLKLREHCSRVETPQNFRPAPGTVCCAQFSEDKQWYRAQVLAYSSEKSVCVGYLDFGNSEEVDLNRLRPISPALLAFPMQAIPCSLGGVQPVGDSWSEECISALLRIISNKMVHIEIQSALKGKALVKIIEGEGDSQINVAELLISVNYAIPVESGTPQQTKETTASAEPPASPPVSDPLVWSCAELPSDGQTVALLASVVKSPAEFYCCVNNSNDYQELVELGVQLKQHCESNSSSFTPTVGEPCCVQFTGDGKWYRAMVKELFGDVVNVNLVDFGQNMTVNSGCIRSITPKLLKLPFQAVRCWLTGVEPSGSEWKSEALTWFQNLVDGVQLLARVVSVSEQGYGVELESGGQSVAVALVAQGFAKNSGDSLNDPVTSSNTKPEDLGEEKQNQTGPQPNDETRDVCEETKSEEESQKPSEVAAFSVDWKTSQLPLNETFQPCVAAVINPSLFYLLHPIQVDPQNLQEVMLELALHCNTDQNSVTSRPVPGAACCARFSVDDNWYRAVILEVGEAEMSVIYADYGNSEKVPVSRILPIPTHLLELPFQITRCALTGSEHFPAEWPPQVQQMFHTELSNDVTATVQSFDGSANVLSVSLSSERGGWNLAAMIQEMLHVNRTSRPLPDAAQGGEQPCSGVSHAAEPDRIPSTPQNELEESPEPVNADGCMETRESAPRKEKEMDLDTPVHGDPVEEVEQRKSSTEDEAGAGDLQSSGCCCQSLKKQMDRLEEMIQLLLSLQAKE